MSTEEEQTKLFKTHKEKIIDQFQLVEQKITTLIKLTKELKQEKADLVEKLQVQKKTLETLSRELASLKAEKEKEKHRILTLIERADQIWFPTLTDR